MRSQQDADIANHRQYDIRYLDSEPLPERVDPRIISPSKHAAGGGRSHGHNAGQFYEGENVERGDYGPQRYSDPDRILPERQSRYQETGYHDPHHHPVSRDQSYAVTRRQDYYDPYEDSQPSYNDHVITRHQMGADRQLATLG